MNIPLSEFESHIDETILKRGFSYYKSGAITDFTEITSGTYEAQVIGTVDYTTQITVQNNIIVAHNCDCPYDWGPVCKHIVASVFYLQYGTLSFGTDEVAKPKKKNNPKRTKPIAKQVEELLKTISPEQLQEFVQSSCKADKKFRTSFLTTFGHLTQDQSKAFYQNQIKSILKTARGRDGWIDWSNMKYVVNTTEPFVINAEKYLEEGDFKNVFFISSALLEEFTEAFDFADDSNGELGYFIESAILLLSELPEKELTKPLRDEIFEYCIDSFNKEIFIGWDWHMEMLYIASELAEDEKETDIILDCLDTFKNEYEKQRAQAFKLRLLRKFKDEKEVTKYIENHISNPYIRNDEIANAFKSKNYERAIKLSKEGIEQDKKDKPGLVKDWYNWLLEIAQEQKDIPKIITYSRFLFIDNFYPKQDYYHILKTTVKPEDWHLFLEELITEIKLKKNWIYSETLRKIYIEEQSWDGLFEMLKQNPSFEEIRQNEEYLSQDYSAELLQLYRQAIVRHVDQNMGRKHYQTACRYLRRMKKLGGQELVDGLIADFRVKYSKRKALMEELNQV